MRKIKILSDRWGIKFKHIGSDRINIISVSDSIASPISRTSFFRKFNLQESYWIELPLNFNHIGSTLCRIDFYHIWSPSYDDVHVRFDYDLKAFRVYQSAPGCLQKFISDQIIKINFSKFWRFFLRIFLITSKYWLDANHLHVKCCPDFRLS